MRLSVKAFALAFAILWGGVLLLVGIAALVWDGYAAEFLAVVASIYPGYATGGVGSVVVLALYGVVDAGLGGAIFAWLYNRLVGAAAH